MYEENLYYIFILGLRAAGIDRISINQELTLFGILLKGMKFDPLFDPVLTLYLKLLVERNSIAL